MFIDAVGTAVPEKAYTQAQIWEAANRLGLLQELEARSARLLQKVLRSDAIVQRHLCLDRLEEGLQRSPDALHARFADNAPKLATTAARRALEASGLDPPDMDAVIVATCTGYLCPGLTSYVSESLGLRNDIIAMDLVGQGCGAALPAMRSAQALLASGAASHALVVCVEVCSAAFYLDNDFGVLVSACLFGDGAAAIVLSSEAQESRRRVEWIAGGSFLDPGKRDALRFATQGGVLRNVLTPAVPSLAGEAARRVADHVLARLHLGRDDIRAWLLHPGGRDVLSALRAHLGLADQDLRWSVAVLRNFGNLSSPSVLFVLDLAMREAAPAGSWWLSAFGAGFSCHGALLSAE